MKIYYKAVRMNGTDFYTGTVDYAGALASGDPLPLLTSPDDGYYCCSDTVYHASDIPSETLVGRHEWPCRLFEVDGDPVAEEGHKFGFRSLRVAREIESWQVFGPNGQAVAMLIERAGRLTEDEVVRLGDAWSAARGAAGDAAGDAAWSAARGAARGAAGDAAWSAAGDAAWSAVWNVAGALVVRDLISEEHFNTLYGPWASVVEAKR